MIFMQVDNRYRVIITTNVVVNDIDLIFLIQTFQLALVSKYRLKEECKHYYCHHILSQVFAIARRQCKYCIS